MALRAKGPKCGYDIYENAIADRVNTRIKTLRNELRVKPHFEFHFAKLKDSLRCAFLEAVSPFAFEYYSIVINKARLVGPGFHFKGSFYKYACRLVMNNAKSVLDGATIVIDGSGERRFRRELANYFKKQVNDPQHPCRVVKVQIHDSCADNLVQLADMVSGAVARSYSDKSDAKTYRGIIRKREARVQSWP